MREGEGGREGERERERERKLLYKYDMNPFIMSS